MLFCNFVKIRHPILEKEDFDFFIECVKRLDKDKTGIMIIQVMNDQLYCTEVIE